MKKTQLISLSSYCKVKRPWDIQELIYEAVNREDAINYPTLPIKIPEMKYPTMKASRVIGHSFFSKVLP